MNPRVRTDRRHFLIAAGVATAGGVIGVRNWSRTPIAGDEAGVTGEFQPYAFLRIAADDSITVIIGKAEMGQGVHTGLPLVIAEELDVDPLKLNVEFSGVDPAFNDPIFKMQFTGGSLSTSSTFEVLRQAGASARLMLIAAAATRWRMAALALRTDAGCVTDGQRRVSYGTLAAAAARQPVPMQVRLKPRSEFKYVGKPHKRLDAADKVTGRAQFGIDVRVPDMLTAVVLRAPAFGATLRRVDESAARRIPGVIEVKRIPTGVAVIARDTWAAMRGRKALTADWNLGGQDELTTSAQRASWLRLATSGGQVADNVGDTDKALVAAAQVIDVTYEVPYLAHACMEPLNCVAHVKPNGCEIWTGTQNQTLAAQSAAAILNLRPDQVVVHTLFLGGGFGRRGVGDADFVREAVEVARGVGRPVKTVWTREDDMRGGYYRPYRVDRVRAAIDVTGKPTAVAFTCVSKSIVTGTPYAVFIGQNGVDPTSVEGLRDTPFDIPNRRVEVHYTKEAVPVLWWRSVGHSVAGFVINSVVDELAALANRSPLDTYRELLKNRPRHLKVLNSVVKLAGFGDPVLPGRARGIALHESFGSVVAQIAEVSLMGDDIRVHRVSCVVDCGFAVNPNQVVAQMEGAIIFGLSAALYGEITLKDGQVQQGNFDMYRLVRIPEAPKIDVVIEPSDAPLGGIGEPGVPPVAGALCNAVFALTGKRVRRLPVAVGLREA